MDGAAPAPAPAPASASAPLQLGAEQYGETFDAIVRAGGADDDRGVRSGVPRAPPPAESIAPIVVVGFVVFFRQLEAIPRPSHVDAAPVHPHRVLDMGCAVGRECPAQDEHIAANLRPAQQTDVGVDRDQVALDHARYPDRAIEHGDVAGVDVV